MNQPFDSTHVNPRKESPIHQPGGTPSPAEDTHTLSVTNREEITVRGVTDVRSFDEDFVDLETTRGRLTLEGRGLRVTVLDTKGGVVSLTGTLTGLLYDDPVHPGDQPAKGAGGRKSRFPHLFG